MRVNSRFLNNAAGLTHAKRLPRQRLRSNAVVSSIDFANIYEKSTDTGRVSGRLYETWKLWNSELDALPT